MKWEKKNEWRVLCSDCFLVFNECKSICRCRDKKWFLMISFVMCRDSIELWGWWAWTFFREVSHFQKAEVVVIESMKKLESHFKNGKKIVTDFEGCAWNSNDVKAHPPAAVVFKPCGISLSIKFVFVTHVILSSNNSRSSWQRQTYELSVVGTQISVHRLSNCWQMFSREGDETLKFALKRDRFVYFHQPLHHRCLHECRSSSLQWCRPMATRKRKHLLSTVDSWNRLPGQFCKLRSSPKGNYDGWKLNGKGRKEKKLSVQRFSIIVDLPWRIPFHNCRKYCHNLSSILLPQIRLYTIIRI